MFQVGTIRGPGAFGLLGIGQDVLMRQGRQGGYGPQDLLLLHRIMAGDGNLRLEFVASFRASAKDRMLAPPNFFCLSVPWASR